MKEYNIVYQKTPDWSKIEKAPMDVANWMDNAGVTAEAQLAWNEDGIMYHGVAHEANIRATFDEPCGSVWEDSCLEFFFMPEGEKNYLNVEVNPNGAIYFGIGPDMPARARILLQDEKGILNIKTNRTEDGWELFFSVPVSLLQYFYPGYELTEGGALKANLMKCGDLCVKEHFLSWLPFDPENINFHNSDYFGRMNFVK